MALLCVNFALSKKEAIMKTNTLFHFILAACFILIPNFLLSQDNAPTITKSVFFGKSNPIRESKVVLPGVHEDKYESVGNRFSYADCDQTKPADKPVLQKEYGTIRSRGPVLNFEGVGNVNGIRPADPNGEVGPNHYLQTVNSSFAVWDKV